MNLGKQINMGTVGMIECQECGLMVHSGEGVRIKDDTFTGGRDFTRIHEGCFDEDTHERADNNE